MVFIFIVSDHLSCTGPSTEVWFDNHHCVVKFIFEICLKIWLSSLYNLLLSEFNTEEVLSILTVNSYVISVSKDCYDTLTLTHRIHLNGIF